MKLLANTGFLFAALPFADRLAAAAAAGFDGVEFHDEWQRLVDPGPVADMLRSLPLSVGGLNVRMGETSGVAALPGLEVRFAEDMKAAHRAAEAIGAPAIHVLSGKGATDEATYRANLRRALDLTDRLILIEPICPAAIPGYHLASLDHAVELASTLGPRLRIMFDWFHVTAERGEAGAYSALERYAALVGHVQLAASGTRAEPPIDLVAALRARGCLAVGMEYRPTQPEEIYLKTMAQR